MRATNSNAQFTYTKPKGVNNMGTEQMKENLESDLGKQDINITPQAPLYGSYRPHTYP